ncbi:2-deoxy-scyllo-inosose synthase (DOI synthase) (DOIS) [Durusdinium trenchii]|uniref:2-deoxy-scyllo-inosose synthase (DOI synthase) (DOIS) n=1 Tax=Durusdinium trenchii TaxID=1381693 RepID=A0ABP0R345_9DINO
MAGQKAPEPDQVQADKLVQVVEERDMTKGTDSQSGRVHCLTSSLTIMRLRWRGVVALLLVRGAQTIFNEFHCSCNGPLQITSTSWGTTVPIIDLRRRFCLALPWPLRPAPCHCTAPLRRRFLAAAHASRCAGAGRGPKWPMCQPVTGGKGGREITFKFADRAEVPGWLGVDVQSEVIGRILEVKPDRILLVTETVVDELHGDYFKSELFSGLGELAKNAALLGGKHAEGFRKALSSDRINADAGGSGDEFTMDDKMLMELLALGIDAKMSVLADDAYEKNCGMIFEYGHTVSHAIEKAYGDGVIPHGLGVTYGMLSSSYAAEQLGIMDKESRREHDELCWLLLRRWPLPEPRPSVEKAGIKSIRKALKCLLICPLFPPPHPIDCPSPHPII